MRPQHDSYAGLSNRYDDAITARRWWSKLYLHAIWGIDYNRIAHSVCNLLPCPLNGKLLEVPIGTAVFTASYYQRQPEAKIVGVDFSQQMLDIALQRLNALEVHNVTLVPGDVTALPFHGDTFDYVLTMNGMQSFPDRIAALQEMARILRPGGSLYGSFYTKGLRPLADWIARVPLEHKKIFFRPHWTPREAHELLQQYVGPITHAEQHGPIFVFACSKR